MKFRSLLSLALFVAAIVPAATAHADRRAFLETYEYNTLPENNIELEFWNRQQRDSFAPDSPRVMSMQIELEYGITSRWEIALYQTFVEADSPAAFVQTSLHYDATKIENRYRLGDRGAGPVDVTLYFEVEREFGADAWELEPKIILAHDFGKLTAAFNAVFKFELERERSAGTNETELETKAESGWAFGLSYELSPKFKLGAETFGSVELASGHETTALAGPSISWAPTPNLWIASTAAFGITDDSARFQFGFVAGLGM